MNTPAHKQKTPFALYALAIGAFGIGTSEFVIMGLLLEISKDFGTTLFMAGMLITGYALGVVVGAPILTIFSTRFPRKTMLLALMAIFTLGNLLCALAPSYWILMAARIVTSFAHGAFFGIGAVTATSLVAEHKKASAIALMFTGLTVANIMGVPFGTWLGQHFGWRATFWAVTAIGPIAFFALARFLPKEREHVTINLRQEWRAVHQPQVLVALLTTVLGFAGVFAILTYIAPFLTSISGFEETAISPILILFGGGLIVGNILGGKLADKSVTRALYLSLFGLAVCLVIMTLVGTFAWLTVLFLTLVGVAGFATVPGLQMSVLSKASDAPTLASALNIAAFNLGNALGAWSGGLVIDKGIGLAYVPLAGAAFAAAGMLAVTWSRQLAKTKTGSTAPAMPPAV